MKKRLLLIALLVVGFMATSKITLGQIPLPNPTQDIPIVGSFTNGNFVGTLDIVRFVQSGSQIVAVGSLTGTLTDAAGNTVGTVAGTIVNLPVSQIIGSCDILHLELGPLDLDLLGLVVHLDQIVLDISADPGAGNLLGNLLCSIAGLLDGGPGLLLFLVVGLLNQILGVLG